MLGKGQELDREKTGVSMRECAQVSGGEATTTTLRDKEGGRLPPPPLRPPRARFYLGYSRRMHRHHHHHQFTRVVGLWVQKRGRQGGKGEDRLWGGKDNKMSAQCLGIGRGGRLGGGRKQGMGMVKMLYRKTIRRKEDSNRR